MSKILVGFDNSLHSKAALDLAVKLASQRGQSITIAHVIERPTYVSPIGAEEDFRALQKIGQEMMRRGSSLLYSKRREVEGMGVKAYTKLLEGNPGDELVRESETGEYDLLVVGTRGMGGLKSLLVGSVSNKVVHHAKIPVLLSR